MRALRVGFYIVVVYLVLGFLALKADSNTAMYTGILSAAEHEMEEGVFNLVTPQGKPVLTIMAPEEWRRELREFVGQKVTVTFTKRELQEISR